MNEKPASGRVGQEHKKQRRPNTATEIETDVGRSLFVNPGRVNANPTHARY